MGNVRSKKLIMGSPKLADCYRIHDVIELIEKSDLSSGFFNCFVDSKEGYRSYKKIRWGNFTEKFTIKHAIDGRVVILSIEQFEKSYMGEMLREGNLYYS